MMSPSSIEPSPAPTAPVRRIQGELTLPAPPLAEDQPPVPARMVNEFQYCPRLAWLEWVEGEWADNADTADGRRIHARIDAPTADALPDAEGLEADDLLKARAVTLSSATLGVIAKLDLIEAVDGTVVPIDYKRGRRPHVAAGAHDPERVQLCLQGLLLREHGYRCDEGSLYFRESRERVRVPFDEALEALTRAAVHGVRLMVAGGRCPPPTAETHKCPRCALVGICLPDEVRALTGRGVAPRSVAVPRLEAMPVYLQAGRGKVSKSGEMLEIALDDQPTRKVRLIDVSDLVIFGNVHVTTPCQTTLMQREIPITWLSHGGWFFGHTIGIGHKNVALRTAQYRHSFDQLFCTQFARDLVCAKIRNCRTLLRRNARVGGRTEAGDSLDAVEWGPPPTPDALGAAADAPEIVAEAGPEAGAAGMAEAALDRALAALKTAADKTRGARDLGALLGVEGTAAAAYFGAFSRMIRPPAPPAGAVGATAVADGGFGFDFTRRNRRPPADPVNALLSFAYALLLRLFTVQLSGIGLDPYRGFYHQPRYGRPALALDVMEPYRPLIADSAVLTVINNGEVKPDQFVRAAGTVAMAPAARKALIAAFERRLAQEMTHPTFGYSVTWRQALHIQARLLARYLSGEVPRFDHIIAR